MLQWKIRYLYFLRKKARASSSVPLIELQWQMIPWLIPLLIAAMICYIFDLTSPKNLLVIVPLGSASLAGIALVGWIFAIEGPITDSETAKRPSDD